MALTLEAQEVHSSRGPAPNWNLGRTRSIRVPIVLANTLLEIARRLDSGELVDSTLLAPVAAPNPIKKSTRSSISNGIRYEILKAAGFRCQACGASASVAELQVDHIIPVSKGGSNKRENLQALCRDCNIGKYNKV